MFKNHIHTVIIWCTILFDELVHQLAKWGMTGKGLIGDITYLGLYQTSYMDQMNLDTCIVVLIILYLFLTKYILCYVGSSRQLNNKLV